MIRLGVLASGSGTNLQALLDACARAAPLLVSGDDEKYQGEVLRLAPAEKGPPRGAPNGVAPGGKDAGEDI